MVTSESWLLVALLALGFMDVAAIVIGWLADHHITRTAHHRKDG